MRSIEAVAGKRQYKVPYMLRGRFVYAMCNHALDHFFRLFNEQLLNFFTDGLAQNICFPVGKTGKVSRNLEYLFLIHGDAVGFIENGSEFRMQIFDSSLFMLTGNICINEFHGTGPVERDHGDDILNLDGLEFLEISGHAVGFKLEDAGGIAALQKLERFRIVERQCV